MRQPEAHERDNDREADAVANYWGPILGLLAVVGLLVAFVIWASN